MSHFRSFAFLAVAGAALGLAGPAAAQVKTWNFGDTTIPGACTGTYTTSSNANYSNTINCSQQPDGQVVDLWARAYSSDASGATYRRAGINQQGTGSGFGVWNQSENFAGSPQHAMDNSTPGIDMLLLQFTAAEVLKTVTIGWSGADGDFQVLRWTGPSDAGFSAVNTSILGKTANNLVAAGGGWELVTLVDGAGNINTPDVVYGVNAGNASSSFWLISAYNSGFGGSGATSGIDAIKVLGVTTGTPVSAPGTLALAGLGLLGAGVVRRRRG